MIKREREMDTDGGCRCIKLLGLPEGVSRQMLEQCFSNTHWPGGATVLGISMNSSQYSAVVEFRDPAAVQRLLSEGTLFIFDKQVTVQKHYATAATADEAGSQEECVVKVTGLPSDIGEEHVQLYFENPKRSGGGDIKDLQLKKNGSMLITFHKREDAERVLAKSDHEIKKTKIKVSRWRRPEQRTLKVSGLPPLVEEEILELFFENEKKSGGGNVTKVQILNEGSALVTFEEEKVCLRVLQREGLVLGGVQLSLSLWEEEDEEERRTVIVSGFDPKTPDEMIRLLFENKKKSRGGEIDVLEFLEKGTARITFMDVKVAERVLAFGDSEGIRIGGTTLSISPCPKKTNSLDKAGRKPSEPTDTVQVSGLTENVSKDTVQLYFENKRRSGGGEVSNISHQDDGTMLIKFCDPQVAASVLSKNHHAVNGVKLQVTSYHPPRPIPMDPTKVFIQGVNTNTTKECLIMYIERCCGQEPVRIVPGKKIGTYMLLFQESVDLARFQESCKQRPLEKCLISVSGVPVSHCIRVTNLNAKITRDALQFYFENKRRSYGGPVQDVELFREEGYALVHFVNQADLDEVLQHNHVLEDQRLSLSVHYDCLGVVKMDGWTKRQ